MKLCNCCLENLRKAARSKQEFSHIKEQIERIPEPLLPCPKCQSKKLQFVWHSIDMTDENVKMVMCFKCNYMSVPVDGGMKEVTKIWNNDPLRSKTFRITENSNAE